MQCPKCGYLMSSFDDECPRCKNMGSPTAPPPATNAPTNTVTQSAVPIAVEQSLMGVISRWVIYFGIIGVTYFYFSFNTAVQVPASDFMGTTIGGGYVNNIGLMADRQNGILFSFGIVILGCFFMFMDRSNPNKQPLTDEQKKILRYIRYCYFGIFVAIAMFEILLLLFGSGT